MMDAVDGFELPHHGIYPIAFDRRWHCGAHLMPRFQNEPVRAIADGEVVAYRVCQKAITDGSKDESGAEALNSNLGFVLLKHSTETGDGRAITFYSLYMHLLDLDGIRRLQPQPNNPPEVGTSMTLPLWLLRPTNGVQVPARQKVYRKDMLGYPGACHGQLHLHFEIFMTEGDFTAWFSQPGHAVQLDNNAPTTPASKDYWGHSYFVIPQGQSFVSVPPEAIGAAAKYFPPLQAGTLPVGSKLYVEAFFHKGQRYTRSWLDRAGTITSLTPVPVPADKDYEYEMYARATALYPQCPSDGYEMLRFGRILTEHANQVAAPPKTWIPVTFEAGKQGYVDISQSTIQKLSDADFPFFMGWQKIQESNTPFSQDGLCDYDELRRIVGVAEDLETPAERLRPEWEQEDKLAAYIQTHPAVREKLRGFICHAPSEWDASGNDARYGRLNDPDGFFGKRKVTDPDGYANFLRFHTQLQFMEQTPLAGGRKFWFFHPLAFVRYFRRCGWLSNPEFKKMFPITALRKKSTFQWVSEPVQPQLNLVENLGVKLNKAMRKFGITTPLRQAAFLGNAMQETQWFRSLAEGAPEYQRYYPWFGRGFLQLTWPDNYVKYWKFDGRQVASTLSGRLHEAAIVSNRMRSNAALMALEAHVPVGMKKWRDDLTEPSIDASDSAGAYWAWSGAARSADQSPVFRRESVQVGNASKPYYSSESFGKVAATVNVGQPSRNFEAINGLQARYQAYVAALLLLTEGVQFPIADGTLKDFPDH